MRRASRHEGRNDITRRRLLAGAVPLVGAGMASAAAAAQTGSGHTPPPGASSAAAHGAGGGHAALRGREVDHAKNGFDPHAIVRDFDEGKTRRTASGRVVREWELYATEQQIELAPGVFYDAWSYNGRIPGPTLRAKEGELLRIRFTNASRHPHTIHFHGIHPSAMDGVPGQGAGQIEPGGSTVYEFEAQPAGLHLYHCHVRPLAEHIAKGLYGAFIIDPKEPREEADELVMVLNGFDTNFDRANEFYAANTIPFAYMDRPIQIKRDELVRIYLVNILEYDLINSFHLHANLFNYFPTGTMKAPTEFTDVITQCQGQRGVLEFRYATDGKFMFHAHQSEFTELGWQGFFEVTGS